jgi:hypothetical protein
MKRRRTGLILLIVQLMLVLSVAGKYLYERKFCPRVWTRATQFDPSLPLRGRYLALQLLIDACSLPKNARYYTPGGVSPTGTSTAGWNWPVTAEPVNGHLVARLVDPNKDSVDARHILLGEDQSCTDVPFDRGEIYFIPDTAKSPFPLQPRQQLWVEVTLPAAGPPRPIQLALSDSSGFHPLKFE